MSPKKNLALKVGIQDIKDVKPERPVPKLNTKLSTHRAMKSK